MIRKLWKHQEECVRRFTTNGMDHFALFLDVGTGKSATLITMLRHIYTKNLCLCPTLILCPKVVCENWKREILEFSNIKQQHICILDGSRNERKAVLTEDFQKQRQYKIYITNYEALNDKSLNDLLKKLFTTSLTSCLVLDESHRCKDIKAMRTKICIEFGEVATYRFILSGSPILNNYMDIFSQFWILDRGKTFGRNFWSFRAKYFFDKNAGMPKQKYFPNWKPLPEAKVAIEKAISAHGMSVQKKDCLDLPPLVKTQRFVEMEGNQKKAYDSMLKDLIAFIVGDDGKNRAAVAELAITKALRLQQIVTGFVNVEGVNGEREPMRFKNNYRKDTLEELLEEITPNHKVLVWAVFHENYKDVREVCESLNIKYVELHGGISDKEKSIQEFNHNPDCRVLIGHPGSGGIGVNLIAASYSIYYSRSFSLEYDLQSEARNYRGGSEVHEKITRIDLVTKDTIDEKIFEALRQKKKVSFEVLKGWVLDGTRYDRQESTNGMGSAAGDESGYSEGACGSVQDV